MTENDDEDGPPGREFRDVEITSVGFDEAAGGQAIENAVGAARAMAFNRELERTIATLDTSRYCAVEVIYPSVPTGLGPIRAQPQIRLVEEGEPYAEDLIESGAIDGSILEIERYSADGVEELRTYAREAINRRELAVLERFVARKLDVPDDRVTETAERILRSLRQHGPEEFRDIPVDLGGDDA